MGAGKLDHRMQFSRRVEQQDGYGNMIADWQPEFEAWCDITFLKGSETVLASRLEGRSPVIIKLRSSTDSQRVTHEWRAKHLNTGVVYEIKEMPRPTEDRAYLEMMATNGVAG